MKLNFLNKNKQIYAGKSLSVFLNYYRGQRGNSKLDSISNI